MGRPPECSLVNDRPVKIVETPDGGADCIVLDWTSGSFVIDRSYFSRTLPGDFADVDSVTPEQMDAIVAEHRARILHRLAVRLATADVSGGSEVLELLGLRPELPPFDADDMEATVGPGLLVVAPRLVRRQLVDAVFGTARSTAGPADTIAVVYRATPGNGDSACTVLAVFPSDAPTAEALLVQLARVEGPTDLLTTPGRIDAP